MGATRSSPVLSICVISYKYEAYYIIIFIVLIQAGNKFLPISQSPQFLNGFAEAVNGPDQMGR